MMMNFPRELQIEDLRNHSAEVVMRLQNLLVGPVKVHPDPKRAGFYELEGDARVYYIHMSPITGTIFFLATWGTVAA